MKNKIEQVGHRLQYMELLNWGTFRYGKSLQKVKTHC